MIVGRNSDTGSLATTFLDPPHAIPSAQIMTIIALATGISIAINPYQSMI